jgi:hypothetical protein
LSDADAYMALVLEVTAAPTDRRMPIMRSNRPPLVGVIAIFLSISTAAGFGPPLLAVVAGNDEATNRRHGHVAAPDRRRSFSWFVLIDPDADAGDQLARSHVRVDLQHLRHLPTGSVANATTPPCSLGLVRSRR